MSTNKKTLIDGDFQVGSAHFYVDVINNRVGLNQSNPTSSLDVNGNAFIGTDMTVASNVTVGSNVIAQKFTGSASGLTSVPADQISGVIPVANGGTGTTATTGTGSLVKSDNPTFTGTVTAETFSGSGASLTNIPMGQATGTLAVANGGTGVTTSTGTGNTVLSASPTLTGAVTAETANFSSNVSASNVYAGYDTDMTSYLGRAAVGFSGISDEATFAHIDVNSTNNYALKQTATGGTHVNSATSKSTIFSINDSEQARINTTGLGVGTNNPQFKLDVHGTANVGVLTCTSVSGDGSGLTNISGYSWPTHANGNDIYYTTGNVGIGTETPGNTFEVAGTASVSILKSAASAATSTFNFILNGPRPGTTSGGAIHFINGSTRTLDGGVSTYTIRNDSGALRLGNVSYNTLIEGNVGIGVTDPDSKLEVRGNIRASFSDTDHGMFIDAGGTIRRDYGGNGAGFHFTTNAIFPTNYLGSYSAGGIDLGSSTYRWNNVYTEALNASGTITATTFSGALSGNATSATNADTVDGLHASSFLRSDADDTVNAGVTYTWTATDTHGIAFKNSSYNTFLYLGGWSSTNSDNISRIRTSSGNLHIDSANNGNCFLNWYSAGTIELGRNTNVRGTVTAPTFSATSQIYLGTSASIRQPSSTWTGDPGSGVGKIEYHSNRWYVVAGSNSTELLRVRRNNSDKFAIDNNGSISLGTVPAARISGTVASATNADTVDGLHSSSFFRRDTTNDVDVRLTAADGRGLRFWDSDSYKIYMSNATNGTWGGRLDGSDYNMYFRMTGGTTRGFVFLNNRTVRCHINGNGDLYLNGGWLRTYGERGWYNETYGGGWHMTDSTWVKAYNGKGVYTTGAFYTDGNRSVIRGDSPTLYFRDTNNNSAMWHCNGNLMYLLRGGNDTETWTQVNGQWPFVFNLTNNDATCGGNLYTVGFFGLTNLGTTRFRNSKRLSLGQLSNHGLESGGTGFVAGTDKDDWSIWESNVKGEGSCILINGDTIAMCSPVDRNALNYYDEDGGSRVWHITGTAALVAASDVRLKTDICDLVCGGCGYDRNIEFDNFKKLRSVSYKLKKPESVTRVTSKYDQTHYGFIAQEVYELFPESVEIPEDGGYYAINYSLLNFITINVLKTEITKREALEKENQADKVRISELEAKVENLQTHLSTSEQKYQDLLERVVALESV